MVHLAETAEVVHMNMLKKNKRQRARILYIHMPSSSP